MLRFIAGLGLAFIASGCALPECVTPRYDNAECRVIAENEHARLRTSTDVEVRFLEAGSRAVDTWDAAGLLTERADASVAARVAGLGGFTIALRREDDGPTAIELHLSNVDARATIVIGPDGEQAPVATPDPGVTQRSVAVALPDARPVFVEGTTSCPSRYRVAVAADIQTNPDQFARIVEAMTAEWALSDDEPLLGLLIAGDLSEASRDEEFEQLHEILASLPFPAAVTVGNHDIFRPSRPHFTRNFGPGNYAFSICRTRVTMLDSGNGSLAPSIEARLPELLDARGQDTSLLVLHHPPYAGWTGSGWSREDQAAHLLVEAAIADIDLILAGHNHALLEFPDIPVGDTTIREIIAGTGGANQGIGNPRYGYVRLTLGDTVEACFVEVLPPGYAKSPNDPPSIGLCD